MNPYLVDKIFLVMALSVPIIMIIKWRFKGVFIGAIFMWITLLLSGVVLSSIDPERGGNILDGIWLFFGIIGSIIYCLAIWLTVKVFHELFNLN